MFLFFPCFSQVFLHEKIINIWKIEISICLTTKDLLIKTCFNITENFNQCFFSIQTFILTPNPSHLTPLILIKSTRYSKKIQ